MNRPLCISTIDFKYFRFGGVLTKALIFAQIAKEEGFSPFFIAPSVNLHRTLRRTLRGEKHPPFLSSEFDGYPYHEFAAHFPEIESNAHSFSREALGKLLSKSIPCFVISGNNHAAKPFLDLDLSFSTWAGTTYWEDCRDRILKAPWSIRKALDLLSKNSCEKLEHLIFQRAAKAGVDTTYTKKFVIQIDPSFARKILVLPVAVNTDEYQPAKNPSRKGILFIGRLDDPRKNLSLLLDAFSKFAAANLNHDLILIGSANEEMKARLRKHPFSNRIQWLGQIGGNEKIRQIQNALTLVVPSFQEGFGIVGNEALACGIPVISTPCGGTEDYVIHEKTGLLLKKFDSTELSDSLIRLATDSTFYKTLSEYAREYCVKNLSMDAVRPKIKDLIYSVAAS